MKNLFLLGLVTFLLFSFTKKKPKGILVKNIQELNNAIHQAKAGDQIVLRKGIWKDAQIEFYGKGSKEKPITLRAEKAGEVFLEGESYIHLGGEHLVVDGLFFRNGYSPKNSIIAFQIGQDSTAFHSKITNCVIKDFTKPNRATNDHWIQFFGQHNTLEHCYISGKSNDGETLRVFQTGNKHNKNHHQIIHNYFGPRPRKGGPRAETIRVGDSKTHMTPGYVNVSNNYFEACNGEVEIISDKTNFNTYKNNIFYKCEGSLVLRHGSFATVDSNIFIGGDDSEFYGGIRVINTGHWITNNYFYKINGSEFRSPLAMMNGIPKSQLNRYRPVTDVVVAHNTWVDCKSPFQIGVGQNIKSANVLPEVEIRSASPIRSIIANNIIYNHKPDDTPVINHHKIEGILFSNNLLDNNNKEFTKFGALQHQQLKMKQINEWLFVPEDKQSGLINETYKGFDFDKIEKDLFGNLRKNQNYVGAINSISDAENFNINKEKYGPSWFSTEKETIKPNVLVALSTKGNLALKISEAKAGDIIELKDKMYSIDSSLKIDKEITITSSGEKKAQIIYNGATKTPAFRMFPNGKLTLDNITLKGQKTQLAFAPLDQKMASAYNLNIDNCFIEDFNGVLKASKGSFADAITVTKTIIQNCENGIILNAEEKGDYNAEMVSFKECTFTNIQQNIINFYRGGYDESTIGGYLTLAKNTFSNCGEKEEKNILLKTRGIINVFIEDNIFKNNPVKFVAILWGVKNNHHKNNTLENSGEIKVEEQQKLKILY